LTGPDGVAAQLAAQFSVLLPDPVSPGTVGGFVQWIGYGSLAVVMASWAVVSAADATREEKNGDVDALLAAGMGRADLQLWRFVAFASYAALAAFAAGAGFAAAVLAERDSVDLAALAGSSSSLLALALACYGLALLVGQVTGPRLALAASGAVILLAFLLNSLSRVLDGLRPWRALSPFHYFEASQPLAAGSAFDIRAVEVLVGFALMCVVLAAVAFEYRDVGEGLWRPQLSSLPWPVSQAAPPVLWAAGLSALAAIIVEVARRLVAPLLLGPDPRFQILIRQDVFPSVLGSLWFGIAQLLLIGYVITRVAEWSATDDEGGLELMLAAAASRTAIVVRRGITVAVGVGLLGSSAAITIALASGRDGLSLSTRNLFAATLMLVLFALVFAAAGLVLVAWIPRAAAGVLAALTLATYALAQLGPLFRWPAWTQDLSPFHLDATALTQAADLNWLVVTLAAMLAGFAASALLMQRRDVGS
jgi:ABC-2 type transport system permease protein